MKLAFLFKGPVRPSCEVCIDDVNRIKSAFSNHHIDDYAFAWYSDEAIKFAASKTCKNVILLQEPDSEYITTQLLTTRTPDGHTADRAFKHFWMMKFASEFILKMPIKYDHVIYARLDTKYEILNPDAWLNPNHYISGPFNLDIMGSATPENLAKMWDYRDLETLNRLYGASREPEGCWQKIREMNGDVYLPMPTRYLGLNPPTDNCIANFSINR